MAPRMTRTNRRRPSTSSATRSAPVSNVVKILSAEGNVFFVHRNVVFQSTDFTQKYLALENKSDPIQTICPSVFLRTVVEYLQHVVQEDNDDWEAGFIESVDTRLLFQSARSAEICGVLKLALLLADRINYLTDNTDVDDYEEMFGIPISEENRKKLREM